ncbi:hypothetical protein I4F81_007054 [Pyropia yezoensis]|uniref:Uncharacterized protein n=1 Tax=Pyropia yezoensis TaxID=2788 RepID=A0ACC3C3Q5_PYRYE|nr:hypothetical protein I4F81_007054 [Neopyropia yezoensis]|eukprot:contig_14483_g3483
MGYLVPGTYVDAEDAYDSLRFVAVARSQENLSWDTNSPNGSYRGLVDKQDVDDDHIKTILRQAATIMRVATKRLPNGHVTLLRRMSAIKDPVNKKHLKALLRQRSVRAVAHYRLTGATAMKTAWYKLLHNVGAGVVAINRRVLEFEKSDRPGLTGKRSTRIRLGWGATQMRLLPTPAQLREERRRAFDNEDRIAHFFFTRDGPGELVQWDYIRGSGSAGIRRYRSTEGVEKRLRSYNNRYWEQKTTDDAEEVEEEGEDLSDDEDDGYFFENENAESEGCYAPVEKDAAKLKELERMSHSYLENDDGSGELKILAVGFNVVAALQRGIDRCAAPGPTCAADAATVMASGTLVADGGLVRGKNIKAFTFVLSWPHLLQGRTEPTPMLYSFSGEKSVDELVAKAVRGMVGQVMDASFTIPIPAYESDEAVIAPLDDAGNTRVPVTLHEEVQVCGT